MMSSLALSKQWQQHNCNGLGRQVVINCPTIFTMAWSSDRERERDRERETETETQCQCLSESEWARDWVFDRETLDYISWGFENLGLRGSQRFWESEESRVWARVKEWDSPGVPESVSQRVTFLKTPIAASPAPYHTQSIPELTSLPLASTRSPPCAKHINMNNYINIWYVLAFGQQETFLTKKSIRPCSPNPSPRDVHPQSLSRGRNQELKFLDKPLD